MIEFNVPTMADSEWVKKAMLESNGKSCEYCFGNLYMWSSIYNTTISNYNGLLLAKSVDEEDISFLYPCGKGDKLSAIKELIEYSKSEGKNLVLYSLSDENIEELESILPEKFEYEESRQYFDYLYTSKALSSLSGRKLHSKRNHISFFKKNYSWSYERINENNINDCIKMNEKWMQLNSDKDGVEDEAIAINKAFDKYNELGLVGGLIRIDGEVVAYTFGEKINQDVFCTHVEKAFSHIRGAYPIINQQFCENELMNYKYINREEDLGEEGLRQAKLSYNPEILLKKYNAILKG